MARPELEFLEAQLPSGSQVVLDSDAAAGEAGPGRHQIRVGTSIRVTYGNPFDVADVTWEVKLLNEAGTPVALQLPDGSTGFAVPFTETMAYSGPAELFEFFKVVTVERTWAVRPAEALSPQDTYTALVVLRRNGDEVTAMATQPRVFWHFRNSTPGDASWNVLARVVAVDWLFQSRVGGADGLDHWSFRARAEVRRWDEFNAAMAVADVPLAWEWTLTDPVTRVEIPLGTTTAAASRAVASWSTGEGGGRVPESSLVLLEQQLDPAAFAELPGLGNYLLSVSLRVIGEPGAEPALAGQVSTSGSLLSLSGRLLFNQVEARLRGLPSGWSLAGTLPPDGHPLLSFELPGLGQAYLPRAIPVPLPPVALQAAVLPNGDLKVTGGEVPMGATEVPGIASGIRFTVSGVKLNANGARGAVTLLFPPGFGMRASESSMDLFDAHPFAEAALDGNFRPLNQIIPGPLLVADESLPWWFGVSSLLWRVEQGEIVGASDGRLHYVREGQVAESESFEGAFPAAGPWRRPSNERLFRRAQVAVGESVVVTADPESGAAQMSCVGTLMPDGYAPHFPAGTYVAWTQPGAFALDHGRFVPGSSRLSGVAPVGVQYAQGCPEGGCPGGTGMGALTFSPAGARLVIGPEGGLFGEGSLNDSVRWGSFQVGNGPPGFAHQAGPYPVGVLHVPGPFVERPPSPSYPQDLRAAASLLRGVGTSAAFLTGPIVEWPLTTDYEDGVANYAGLNLRPGAQVKGTSALGGKPLPAYGLTSRSRHYVRRSGVSGIQQAAAGQIPPGGTLYGYPVVLESFGFSFLDGAPQKSVTSGGLSVPYPSGFTVPFEELVLTCNGGLASARLRAGVGDLQLAYWNARFKPLAISFTTTSGCSPDASRLVLDVEVRASHVSEPFHGRLGFKPDGNLLTQSDGGNVSSRLTGPNQITLRGPGSETYRLSLSTPAYFNNWQADPQPPGGSFGFLTFAGRLDVAFFEDLSVQVQTSAKADDTVSPIYLVGGWPMQGWKEGTRSYFNDPAAFDPGNHGFPVTQGVGLAAYRNSAANPQYAPRARRRWLDLLQFDYPLVWQPVLRSFRSAAPSQAELVVLAARHQVKHLSPGIADITFGIEAGLPKISLTELGYNALNAATGVESAVKKALGDTAHAQLLKGLQGLGRLLGPQMNGLLAPALDATLPDSALDQALADLQAIGGTGAAARAAAEERLGVLFSPVGGRIRNAAANLPGSELPAVLIAELDRGVQAVDVVLNVVGKVGDGYPQLQELVKALAALQPGSGADLADLAEQIEQVGQAFDAARVSLEQVRSALLAVRNALGTAGDFRGELNAKLQAIGGVLDGAVALARQDVQGVLLKPGLPGQFSVKEYSKTQFRGLLRQRLRERLGATAFATTVQVALKQRVYDLDATLRLALDNVFQQVNSVLAASLKSALAGVEETFQQSLGGVSQMATAKVSGHAHIAGDTLKELRVDAMTRIPTPAPMELGGFFLFRELASVGPGGECFAAGQIANEITFGAVKVPVSKWLGIPYLVADVTTKFSLQREPKVSPLGLGGSVRLYGNMNLYGMVTPELNAVFALGYQECHLAGFGKMNGLGGAGAVDAGFFFGRACSLSPLMKFDDQAPALLGQVPASPFTGAYFKVVGWNGVPDLGCVFRVRTEYGLRGYARVAPNPVLAGAALHGSVSGDLLCLLGARGEAKLVGEIGPETGLDLSGSATLGGKLGYCPLCKKFSRTVGLGFKSQTGKWEVKF